MYLEDMGRVCRLTKVSLRFSVALQAAPLSAQGDGELNNCVARMVADNLW